MKKILIFYLTCCVSYILLGLIANYNKIDTQEFKFGFSIFLIFVVLIYIPLCTIIVWLFYYSKINKSILSNVFYGILYCIFPSLLLGLADVLSHITDFSLNCIKSDYIFYEIFAIQNLLIVGYGIIKRFIKTKETNMVYP